MIFKNFIWDLLGKVLSRSSGFIVTIVLTTLLEPEDFGVMGICLSFILIANRFIDIGLGKALVQSKTITKKSISSLFWLIQINGILLFVLTIAFSGMIAGFYQHSELSKFLIVLSTLFLTKSLNVVPNSLLVRDLNFKVISIIALVSNISSGIVGVILAYLGYGVWSLVFQNVLASIFKLILTYIYSEFRPSFICRINHVRHLFNFGSKTLLDSIISGVFHQLDALMFGKVYNMAILGYYSRSKNILNYLTEFSSGSLLRVLFPVISQIQDSQSKIISLYQKALPLVCFISVGLSGLLYITVEDLFRIVFDEKWLFSAALIKIMVVNGYAAPISALMINIINGMGYAGKNLQLGLYKKSIGFIPLGIAYFYSIEYYLYATIIATGIGVFLNMYYVGRLLGYKVISQLKPILPFFFSVGVSLFIIYLLPVSFIPVINILINSIIFMFFYIAISFVFSNGTKKWFFDKTKQLLKNKLD